MTEPDAFMIDVDDPRRDDVRSLLGQHLRFARSVTLPEDVFALDVDALVDPAITFYSLRIDGELAGVCALKGLDDEHAELKSMHTAASHRRRGVARALVEHVVRTATARGFWRLSLETGASDAFAPARALYEATGFVPCGTFGGYRDSPKSAFMTRVLRAAP